MVEILHRCLPDDLTDGKLLPGIRPLVDGKWLRVDEAYAAQMTYRRALLADKRTAVLWRGAQASEAIAEVFEAVLELMPAMGFAVTERFIECPDGRVIDRTSDCPLAVLGSTVQQDICILQKSGDEHVLTAAILCFPASWMLAEKAGHPLEAIHAPVAEYDDNIAKRVQRLFDGVKADRPLWRNNLVGSDDPDLFSPCSEVNSDRHKPSLEFARFLRAERQSIVRLPKSRAVVFSIHSYMVAQNRTRAPV